MNSVMTKPDPTSLPCGLLNEINGLVYFPRMLMKIRLQAEERLWEELRENLGKGADGWCCGFLHVSYDDLKARVLEGGSDEEILAWCEAHGRALNETDKLVWSAFISKLGWKDHVSAVLEKRKADSGLADRNDIETMPHYIDVDEGRRA